MTPGYDFHFSPRITQSGFNMIENLVTLFIISVGMLGIAGMQARALTAHQNSYYYSKALILAEDMADRMRANLRGVADERYNFAGSRAASINENSLCVSATSCSSTGMAGHDIWEWQQRLARELPYGIGYICKDSTPSFDASDYIGVLSNTMSASCDNTGESYVIHVGWDMSEEKDGEINITADVEESDGHLVIAFNP